MAISVTANQNTNSTSGSAPFTVVLNQAALTSGSVLIAVVSSTGITPTYTVSDPTNGTWSGPFVRSTQASNSAVMLYTTNNSSSAASLTVTCTITASSTGVMTVFEVLGITTTIDQSAIKAVVGGGSVWTCGPTGSTTNPNELCVFSTRVTSGTETWSSFSPYTLVDSTHLTTAVQFVGYNVLSSTGPQSGSVSGGVAAAASTLIATFLPFVPPPSTKPGGTGSSESDEDEQRERRRLSLKNKPSRRAQVRLSRDVYRDEMEALTKRVATAREVREEIESKAAAVAEGPVPLSVQRYIIEQERELHKQHLTSRVTVYVKAKRARATALERLKRLADIARHNEAVAKETLRKVTERIDEEAATHLMRFLMEESWL